MPPLSRKGDFLLPMLHLSLGHIIRGVAGVALELMGQEYTHHSVCPAMNTDTFPVTVHGVQPNSVSGMAPALVETFLGISVRRSPKKSLGKQKCHFCVGSSMSAQRWPPTAAFSKVRCLSCPPPPPSLISHLLSQSWPEYARLPVLNVPNTAENGKRRIQKLLGGGKEGEIVHSEGDRTWLCKSYFLRVPGWWAKLSKPCVWGPEARQRDV